MLEGMKIRTKFIEVNRNMSVSVGGRNPYRILTHYKKGDEMYEFKSENIWFNPATHIDREEIDVWVDPQNMKKYYMDISFLPNHK